MNTLITLLFVILITLSINFIIFISMLFFFCLDIKWCCTGHGSGSGSGSGSGHYNENNYNSINLKRKINDDIIGKGYHRSGWPKVMEYLNIFDDDKGILFDDFVEQTFCYATTPPIYTEDWIGVFHHPDDIPYYGNSREKLKNLFKQKEFIESAKKLKIAIALSSKLGDYLKEHLDCEVIVLKHPVEFKFKEWDLNKWKTNDQKKILQIGFYLRNTQIFNQIPEIDDIEIVRIWRNNEWMENWDNKIKNVYKEKRENFNKGKNSKFLTPSKFDNMLSENVIITEYMAVSASNVILDCIARNCPLIVNKKPEIVEYLGEDYPLYFNDPKEIPDLIDKIEDAHLYLKKLDKTQFSLENFSDDLLDSIKKIPK